MGPTMRRPGRRDGRGGVWWWGVRVGGVGQVLGDGGLLCATFYAREGLLAATLALGALHYAASLACRREIFHWPFAFVLAGAYGTAVSMLPAAGSLGGIYL